MKKIFLSTMMFASMQFLSASENNCDNYQNFQTTRTNFDDQGYQAQRKFNDNNNNNNYNNQIVEDTRLLTDDYIDDMDLNKHISNSDLSSHNYDNPFYQKYGKQLVRTPNGIFNAYDYLVKEYEYKIDEFMSMVFLYDTKDNEMVIKFCHPGKNGNVIGFEPFRLNKDIILPIHDHYKKDFLMSIDSYISEYRINEIKINKYSTKSNRLVAKITFEMTPEALQTNKVDEDDYIPKPLVKISSNIERSLDINFGSVEDARFFIDFFFEYAKAAEKNTSINYHYKEHYLGMPENHCKQLFLQCESFQEEYKIADYEYVSLDYANNVCAFKFSNMYNNFALDKNLFEQAKKELGKNYSDVVTYEDDDEDIITMLLNGKIDMFTLDVSCGAYHITPTSDFDGDDSALVSEFFGRYASKQFIRVLVKTLELMEQKYFDSLRIRKC